MAKFMIRVELHDAGPEDYNILHDAMQDVSIYRVIEDTTTGIYYALPRGQYHYTGTINTRQVIIDLAKIAIRKTNCSFEIVVTESKGSLWDGLEEIPQG